MAAEIIDGKKIAETIRGELATEIETLKSKHGITPGLAVVLVGENPASQVYVRMKNKAAHKIGVYSEQHTLPADTSEEDLLKIVLAALALLQGRELVAHLLGLRG